jgi:hypothetical protein
MRASAKIALRRRPRGEDPHPALPAIFFPGEKGYRGAARFTIAFVSIPVSAP